MNGEPLDDQRLCGYLELLVGGGNETTRNTITAGLEALLEHPAQAALLVADPDGVTETATEEILRWVSPVIQFARTATVDTELGGQPVRAGDIVVLWYPSANRDERQFPDLYRFDLQRRPNAHVTFGHGEHVCLGANLARLHVGAVREMLIRWVEWSSLRSAFERGPGVVRRSVGARSPMTSNVDMGNAPIENGILNGGSTSDVRPDSQQRHVHRQEDQHDLDLAHCRRSRVANVGARRLCRSVVADLISDALMPIRRSAR